MKTLTNIFEEVYSDAIKKTLNPHDYYLNLTYDFKRRKAFSKFKKYRLDDIDGLLYIHRYLLPPEIQEKYKKWWISRELLR